MGVKITERNGGMGSGILRAIVRAVLFLAALMALGALLVHALV